MYKKFSDWARLNHYRFGWMAAAFALVLLWVMFVSMMIDHFEIGATMNGASDQLLPLGLKAAFGDTKSLALMFLLSCIVAPFLEEGCRAGLCEVCSDDDGKLKYPFLLFGGSCVGFGLLHGLSYYSILIQGSLGMALGLLWFRTNRNADGTPDRDENGKLKKRWPFLANVWVHSAYNFCILGMQVALYRILTASS